MKPSIRQPVFGAIIGLLAMAGTASADLTVHYRAARSELVLFGKQQEAPFGRLRYTIQIKGKHLRTELTDHFGRTLWLIADRETGEAFGLDPETRTWWRDAGVWTCGEIPTQVARGAARLLSTGGIESLDMDMPKPVTLLGAPAHRVDLQFEGRVLGAPQPVDAHLILYFADDERTRFGTDAAKDLYCGIKPSAVEWSRAFTRYLRLPEERAQALAGIVGLPLQIDLTTDLGLGQASVTLVAEGISSGLLADENFVIPGDFTERK